MPIDRPDGRHWCDPASESPGEDGTWKCPGCEKVWRLHDNGIWGPADEERPLTPDELVNAAQEPVGEPDEGDEG